MSPSVAWLGPGSEQSTHGNRALSSVQRARAQTPGRACRSRRDVARACAGVYILPVPDLAEPAPAPAQPSARVWLRVLAIAAIAAAAFAGSGAAMCGYMALNAAKLPPASTTTTLVRGTNAVVVAVRDLALLQTASYHVERVIDLRDQQSHLFGLFQSEDAVLLVAAADIAAGIDLGLLGRDDVRVDPEKHSAFVRLPPATILSVRLDNQSTYVHSRHTDTLALRAKTLETRARQEAERTLEQAALASGILPRARDNAARTVKALIQSLGFQQVEIEFSAD